MCDIDEIQSERDYFWAIAFVEVDGDIDRHWQEYECELPLNFQEIHGILDDFKYFTEGIFWDDDLELFVAQKIWRDKCLGDRICNLEFAVHLKKCHFTHKMANL